MAIKSRPLGEANFPFGVLPDGSAVTCFRLTNQNGMVMEVLDYGCIITSLKIPLTNASLDIVLGFDKIEDYIASFSLPAPPYFGAIIGRYSGRIKNGRFSLGSDTYQLPANNGESTLHGGPVGFDKVIWDVAAIATDSITLEYESPDGDQNFPGQLNVRIKYTLTNENEVLIEYNARSSQDTIINMTQHSYFNLDGHEGHIGEQLLKVNSQKILETDNGIVPTGRIIDAKTVGFDYRTPARCPKYIDDSFAIDDHRKPAGYLKSLKTGLRMTVMSDQPSLHLYVGGNLFGILKGKNNIEYHPHSGICFESQNYPDAPNHDNFPNAVLRAGEIYEQRTSWKFDFDKI